MLYLKIVVFISNVQLFIFTLHVEEMLRQFIFYLFLTPVFPVLSENTKKHTFSLLIMKYVKRWNMGKYLFYYFSIFYSKLNFAQTKNKYIYKSLKKIHKNLCYRLRTSVTTVFFNHLLFSTMIYFVSCNLKLFYKIKKFTINVFIYNN